MNLFLQWYPGDAAVSFAGRVIIEITLVVGLAGLLSHGALRRRPAARHALWLSALIAVALSPLALAGVERAGWTWSLDWPTVQNETSSNVDPEVPATMADAALDSATRSHDLAPVKGAAPEVADGINTEGILEESSRPVAVLPLPAPADVWRSLVPVGFAVWLAGATFLLARLLRGGRQVSQLLSDAQIVQPRRIDKSLAIVAETLKTEQLPPIVTSAVVAGPVVAGLMRPTVVLPVDFVRSAGIEPLADVLIHECAHAIRRDPWIGLAQRLVQLVFWPHPLVYYMNRSLSHAREEVCDNFVLRRGDAASYAQTLLELAAQYHVRPMPAATLAILSPRWKLEDRVAGLLDPLRQRGTRIGGVKFLVVVALLVAGGSALAAGRFDEPVSKHHAAQPEQKSAAPAVALPSPATDRVLRALNKPTDVHFIELPLEDALQFLHEYHNIVVRRDTEAIAAAKVSLEQPVTLQLKGVAFRSVLKLLLEPLALDVFVEEGELVVTTREKAQAQFSDFEYSVPRQLGEIVKAGIPLTGLGDAITETIEPSTWKKNGGQGTLRIEPDWVHVRQRTDVQGRIGDLLRELQQAVRDPQAVADDERVVLKVYSIANLHDLEITDAAILTMLDKSLLAAKSSEERVQETALIAGDQLLMRQPKWIHTAAAEFFGRINTLYENEPTRKLARAVFEQSSLPFEARRRILRKRLAQPVSVNFFEMPLIDALAFLKELTNSQIHIADPPQRFTSVWDSPVNLDVHNESLSSLFDKLLTPQQLDRYVLAPDIIVATSRTEAAQRMEPRVYRIKELVASGETEKELRARIAAIKPDTWAARGGPGTMRSLPGVLIVNHNHRVHDQIERLLFGPKAGQRKPGK